MAVLLAAEHVAGAAEFEVERGDAESGAEFAEFFHGGEAFAGDVGESFFGRNEQIGVGALVGAADAAAELIELGEAEAVGAIDEDGVGARDVEAVFDDGGGDEDVGFVANELEHDGFEFFFAHLAVSDDDAGFGNEPGYEGGERIDGLDAIVDEVDLAVAGELVFDGALDEIFLEGRDDGLNGEAVARRSFDEGHVAETDEGHVQGARNGSGGESQGVDVFAHFLEALFVGDAEALLFVDDEEAEVLKLYVFGEQAMSADDDVDFAGFERGERFLLLGGAAEAAEHFNAQREKRRSGA